MKILLCHSYYTQRGGEDRSFEEERELLLAHGHCVVEYVRRNDELTDMHPLAAASKTLWNRRAAAELAALLKSERPDVLHVTNTFPLISPAVLYAARRQGVPIVQAMRNYRLLCANSYLMRDGRPCESCVGRAIAWPAIQHRCYRGSAAATAVVAAMQSLHRTLGGWGRKVDAFFTLTNFAREKFVAAGLPEDRIHVKYNCVSPDPGVGSGGGGYVAFLARLSPEKGLATVLEAWRRHPALPPLRIAGDGPLAPEVQAAAAEDRRITWMGRLSNVEANQLIGSARAVLMPSVWYETFGRTIVEAYACGTPVIASNLGAMAELVADGATGYLFGPGNAAALAAAVERLVNLDSATLEAMRAQARAAYERQFTPAHNYARLLEIYQLALIHAESRGRREVNVESYRANPGAVSA